MVETDEQNRRSRLLAGEPIVDTWEQDNLSSHNYEPAKINVADFELTGRYLHIQNM